MFLPKLFLFIAVSIVSMFGMSNLQQLSVQEAEDLWRGQALTFIHKIEIKHNHKLATWRFHNKASFEFDITGNYIRLRCIDSEKKIEYFVICNLRKRKEIKNENVSFVSCGKINGNEWIFHMKDEFLDPYNNDIFSDEELVCEKYEGSNIAFGCFGGEKLYGCRDIGGYDFLYKELLPRIPVKRTSDKNLAVNHNNSMIATNLDDDKDTIVILYPQLLNFLSYKNYRDVNIFYNKN